VWSGGGARGGHDAVEVVIEGVEQQEAREAPMQNSLHGKVGSRGVTFFIRRQVLTYEFKE